MEGNGPWWLESGIRFVVTGILGPLRILGPLKLQFEEEEDQSCYRLGRGTSGLPPSLSGDRRAVQRWSRARQRRRRDVPVEPQISLDEGLHVLASARPRRSVVVVVKPHLFEDCCAEEGWKTMRAAKDCWTSLEEYRGLRNLAPRP